MPEDSAEKTLIDGKFEALAPLGAGGMGAVWLCKQLGFDRLVAVKLLRVQQRLDSDALPRFEREAQALSLLKHKNIVGLYGYGQHQGEPYIAMEFVKGQSLSAMLGRNEPIDVDTTLDIAIQVCEGLVCAHAHGIIHRDIKPSNITLTVDGGVKIIDFGLAKLSSKASIKDQQLTEAGTAVGSVLYMSPEQCVGEVVDERSDVYAVGCVMHHCLTGVPPFGGDHSVVVMHQHLSQPLPRLSECASALDRRELLQAVIDAATAKDRNARYQSAQEMLDDLRRVQKNMAVEKVVLPSSSASGSKNRIPVPKILAGCAMVLIAAGVAYGAFAFFQKASNERKEAELSLQYDNLKIQLKARHENAAHSKLLWATGWNCLERAALSANPDKRDLLERESTRYFSEALRFDNGMHLYASADYAQKATKVLSSPILSRAHRADLATIAALALWQQAFKYTGEKRDAGLVLAQNALQAAPTGDRAEYWNVFAQVFGQRMIVNGEMHRYLKAFELRDQLLEAMKPYPQYHLFLVYPLICMDIARQEQSLAPVGDLDMALNIVSEQSPADAGRLSYIAAAHTVLVRLLECRRLDDARRLLERMHDKVTDQRAVQAIYEQSEMLVALASGKLERAIKKLEWLRSEADTNTKVRRLMDEAILYESMEMKSVADRYCRAALEMAKHIPSQKTAARDFSMEETTYLSRLMACAGDEERAIKIAERKLGAITVSPEARVHLRSSFIHAMGCRAPKFARALSKPLLEPPLSEFVDDELRFMINRTLSDAAYSEGNIDEAISLAKAALDLSEGQKKLPDARKLVQMRIDELEAARRKSS
jgi:serine/threonine protein kinase